MLCRSACLFLPSEKTTTTHDQEYMENGADIDEHWKMSEFLEYEALRKKRKEIMGLMFDLGIGADIEANGTRVIVQDKELGPILNTNVPEVIEDVIQPLIPKTLHHTPPNEDYVAPTTKSILDEIFKEFGDEILNITMVEEGPDFNPNKDIEELEKLLANDPKPHYMEI
ncbi:hypothetical protein Tco_0445806 [Tanacetum coccineum]